MTSATSFDPVAHLLMAGEAQPSATAIRTAAMSATYAEFCRNVRRIAGWIVDQTTERHPRVLVLASQGANAYWAMFGALMAGGSYAPVSIDAPSERQRLIAQAYDPDLIITDRQSIDWIDSLPRPVPTLLLRDLPARELDAPLAPSTVAYTMFTSGSTGVPKGVVVGRAALEHYLSWVVPVLGLGPGQACSQHPNIGFDVSVAEIYGTLCTGATLVPIADRRSRLLPARVIKEQSLDVWVSVPSVVDQMHRAGEITPENFQSLRLMFFCGEALLKSHLDLVFAANGDMSAINAYGPTEATVSCSSLTVSATDYLDACEASASLGEPNPGMAIRLERGSHPDEGEIVIYGPQVADGYWRDKDKTEAAFGISSATGDRFYRTGDWAYRRGEHVFFSHRIDRQVKLHGHRIELAEIDVTVRQLVGVGAAVTVLAGERLITFVESDEPVDAAAIQAALRQRLPDYMIPREIRSMPELPRNVNDKIDTSALHKVLNDA